MDEGKICFRDNTNAVDFFLTRKEICDILSLEFGIRPKKSRIINKKLTQLINRLLIFAIDQHKGHNGN